MGILGSMFGSGGKKSRKSTRNETEVEEEEEPEAEEEETEENDYKTDEAGYSSNSGDLNKSIDEMQDKDLKDLILTKAGGEDFDSDDIRVILVAMDLLLQKIKRGD